MEQSKIGSKQKVIISIILIFAFFFVAIVVSTTINFREYGLKHAEDKAELAAEVLKTGLTSHMVNGIMDQRDFFLKEISNLHNISELWVARSPTVIKQYGEGFNNETPRDSTDKEVLLKGKKKSITTETPSKSFLRVTIPFVASEYGNPNCMQCHNAKEGEVLGVVSMIMDTTDIRTSSFKTILYNVGITTLVIILVFIVIDRFIKPYVSIFYSIKKVMHETYRGNYSARVRVYPNEESASVAKLLNSMLEKLETTFDQLDNKVYTFIKNKNYVKDTDPLKNIHDTIDRLSDIYKFKQTIENDKELSDIYDRIAYVLREKFDIDDFTITELDVANKSKKIVYTEKKCHCNILNQECRADRIHASVDSSIFPASCGIYNFKGSEHICTPYSISSDLTLILTIVTTNKADTDRVRAIMSDIEDYIITARPAIISRKLMQILNTMARVDQITGMYNRKFLDEFVDVSIPQALRAETSYAVLMIDIDYFKMINDTYGHDIGDEAIRVVSKVIKENIRKSDIPIRYGGEEFIALLYNCDKENILKIAESIRIEFSKQKIQASGETFSKTLSIGCSQFPKDSESIWKCIKFADISLYKAKTSGRNQVVMFEPEMLNDSALGDSF